MKKVLHCSTSVPGTVLYFSRDGPVGLVIFVDDFITVLASFYRLHLEILHQQRKIENLIPKASATYTDQTSDKSTPVKSNKTPKDMGSVSVSVQQHSSTSSIERQHRT
jgi:hypothetical protein